MLLSKRTGFAYVVAAAMCLVAMKSQAQALMHGPGPGPGPEVRRGEHWVATWSAAPMLPGPFTIDSRFFGNDKSRSFENETVRLVVHTSVGGRAVRVRVSNEFGFAPLRVGAAHVARRHSNSAIHPGGRHLKFNGGAGILIPAGAVAISDPVDLHVPGDSDLAISLYLPDMTEPATYHEQVMLTSYLASAGTGNQVAALDLSAATPTTSVYYLAAVEVLASAEVGTLVALGDSITQGALSTVDENRTWPDLLSDRLNQGRARLSVVNQGIGCNRLLFDFCGPGGAARFDRDVLAVSGVRGVIVHLGLNDIMIPSSIPIPEFVAESVSAADIITGLQQLIARARARDVKIYGATLTPFGSSTIPGIFTPENEAKRQAVNRWIRTSGAFDAVIDFDAAIRDPANPSRMLAIYDADGVHPNDAGFRAMANAINLSMFF